MNPRNGPDIPRLYKKTASRLLVCLLAAGIAAAPLSPLPAQASSFGPSKSIATSAVSLQNSQDLPIVAAAQSAVTYSSLNPPTYTNKPYVTINKNKPKFSSSQLKIRKEYEKYSALDKYGRAQTAIACLGRKTLPTEKRGSIGTVKPAGFKTTKYDFIDGKYLYNRCHLIAYELSGENANKKNLTTGTRYMNARGMLQFEDKVAAYIKKTGNHVLYRATPIYKGTELIPRGVTLEAKSLEDNGKGICFYVYCYNVQPGVKINYKDGTSTATGTAGWKKIDGKWYYFKADGKTAVKSSWLKIDGKVYYVNKNGVRVTGWQTISGKKYHFSSGGIMATGWKTIDKKKYWFDSKGVMATGKKTIGNKTYTFGSDGVLKTDTGSGGNSGGSGVNTTAAYIGNKNTKKFHKSSCSSVGKMNESNKVGFDSRSDAISAGYDPCKICNP